MTKALARSSPLMIAGVRVDAVTGPPFTPSLVPVHIQILYWARCPRSARERGERSGVRSSSTTCALPSFADAVEGRSFGASRRSSDLVREHAVDEDERHAGGPIGAV